MTNPEIQDRFSATRELDTLLSPDELSLEESLQRDADRVSLYPEIRCREIAAEASRLARVAIHPEKIARAFVLEARAQEVIGARTDETEFEVYIGPSKKRPDAIVSPDKISRLIVIECKVRVSSGDKKQPNNYLDAIPSAHICALTGIRSTWWFSKPDHTLNGTHRDIQFMQHDLGREMDAAEMGFYRLIRTRPYDRARIDNGIAYFLKRLAKSIADAGKGSSQ